MSDVLTSGDDVNNTALTFKCQWVTFTYMIDKPWPVTSLGILTTNTNSCNQSIFLGFDIADFEECFHQFSFLFFKFGFKVQF